MCCSLVNIFCFKPNIDLEIRSMFTKVISIWATVSSDLYNMYVLLYKGPSYPTVFPTWGPVLFSP